MILQILYHVIFYIKYDISQSACSKLLSTNFPYRLHKVRSRKVILYIKYDFIEYDVSNFM